MCLVACRHASVTFVSRTVTDGDGEHRFQVFVPERTSLKSLPIILSLHGSGEANGDETIPTNAGIGRAIRLRPERFPAIVVFPHGGPIWTQHDADVAMRSLMQTEREFGTDATRVYLTGYSRGANGAWYLGYRYPHRFAALLVVSGWIDGARVAPAPVVPVDKDDPFRAVSASLKHVPVWVFHGALDQVVAVSQTRRLVAAFQKEGNRVRYSELPGIGHAVWDEAYGYPAAAEWLLAQRKSD
jgi:predicted peptidase